MERYLEPRHEFVLAVLPNDQADRYAAFKKFCTMQANGQGIPSQAILSKTISKGMSVATKVAIQLMVKLGGEAWTLSIPVFYSPFFAL